MPEQRLEVWSAEKGGVLDAAMQIQNEQQHFHISDENANFFKFFFFCFASIHFCQISDLHMQTQPGDQLSLCTVLQGGT